jgi:hypothetical protein
MHDHGPKSAKLGGLLPATTLSVAALMALAPAGFARAASPSARAAKTVHLNENGHLHLTSKHGFTLNEQGSASGTVTGTIYVHLTATSSTRVTAEVNIYHGGSSISGTGTASYHRAGGTESFTGSMSIDRGTGSYAHAHGSGLSFSGAIAESKDDAITVHVSGSVSD